MQAWPSSARVVSMRESAGSEAREAAGPGMSAGVAKSEEEAETKSAEPAEVEVGTSEEGREARPWIRGCSVRGGGGIAK